ncbi:GT-D fold domain-containing glycosyltransferase [Cohnella ginsengisoli]|uniref:GT-D fold domain-containing glycosyltransferase n=1 Tax=Cohnella ginsengisoli TaxID=425004 RepID=A0A9X4KEI4_9BACL|nr:GT-D fold domain-containing glycosyltransferase [Cohnella ginsengisoli]MDG0790587.1 GT-D fold domain-containing glycosyltransferase [Cohnella ginsengisoli]
MKRPRAASRRGRQGGKRAVGLSGRKGRLRHRRPRPNPRVASEAQQRLAPGYDEGYLEGLYDGGERLLEAALPGDCIVPDISVAEVIAAGIPHVLARSIRLLGPEELCAELEAALAAGRPYSVVRLGDGELLTLAQDRLKPAAEIARESPFLSYAGVDAPDGAARDELAAAIRRATVVGVPLSRKPNYQPLLFEALRRNGVPPESLRLTSSMINYALHESGHLMRLAAGKRIAIVGNKAEALARALRAAGLEVVHTVAPVDGMSDYAGAVERAAALPFDLALVSAGIAAVPICVGLAERTGKAAFDFGHMADRLGGAAVPAVE